MMLKKLGKQSVRFETPVVIRSCASVVGPKEGEGPLAACFDEVLSDILAGCESWEEAESAYVKKGMARALEKSGYTTADIDFMLAGDLLNQSMSTTFGIMDFGIPFFGIFGACSTFGEGLTLGSMLIDGGFAERVLVGASSHFCAAEKQFRFPLALGSQRPPTSSWTVTGNGSAVLEKNGNGPRVLGATTGKVVDFGIKDVNNMGAAMAPAAVETIIAHFEDWGAKPSDYDVIATGDLGYIGHELVVQMAGEKGYDLSQNYTDCGILIYDREKQDTHAGGSGCACSAVTFAGHYYKSLQNGNIRKMLLVPTGALLSPTSSQQGNSIPAIAHAVAVASGAGQ